MYIPLTFSDNTIHLSHILKCCHLSWDERLSSQNQSCSAMDYKTYNPLSWDDSSLYLSSCPLSPQSRHLLPLMRVRSSLLPHIFQRLPLRDLLTKLLRVGLWSLKMWMHNCKLRWTRTLKGNSSEIWHFFTALFWQSGGLFHRIFRPSHVFWACPIGPMRPNVLPCFLVQIGGPNCFWIDFQDAQTVPYNGSKNQMTKWPQ